MKTTSIFGGMDNLATGEHYRAIDHAINEQCGNWQIAGTLLQNLSARKIDYFVRNKSWDATREHLMEQAMNAEKKTGNASKSRGLRYA